MVRGLQSSIPRLSCQVSLRIRVFRIPRTPPQILAGTRWSVGGDLSPASGEADMSQKSSGQKLEGQNLIKGDDPRSRRVRFSQIRLRPKEDEPGAWGETYMAGWIRSVIHQKGGHVTIMYGRTCGSAFQKSKRYSGVLGSGFGWQASSWRPAVLQLARASGRHHSRLRIRGRYSHRGCICVPHCAGNKHRGNCMVAHICVAFGRP